MIRLWAMALWGTAGMIELNASPLKSGDWFQMQFAGEGIYKITPNGSKAWGLIHQESIPIAWSCLGAGGASPRG